MTMKNQSTKKAAANVNKATMIPKKDVKTERAESIRLLQLGANNYEGASTTAWADLISTTAQAIRKMETLEEVRGLVGQAFPDRADFAKRSIATQASNVAFARRLVARRDDLGKGELAISKGVAMPARDAVNLAAKGPSTAAALAILQEAGLVEKRAGRGRKAAGDVKETDGSGIAEGIASVEKGQPVSLGFTLAELVAAAALVQNAVTAAQAAPAKDRAKAIAKAKDAADALVRMVTKPTTPVATAKPTTPTADAAADAAAKPTAKKGRKAA
jgi:hypothetical protein